VGTVSIWRRLIRWPGSASRWLTGLAPARLSAARRPAARRSPAGAVLSFPPYGSDGSSALPGYPWASGDALPGWGASALADTDFVVVDLETTGWTPQDARITEIGAVRLCGGRITGEFCTLINPGRPIPADIAALTGISDAMVADAPAIAAMLPDFLAFAGSAVLAAHNAPFDLSFLVAACAACGLTAPDVPVLDTVMLARQVLGEAEVSDCKLSTLASYFDAPTAPCHRALADARATAAVLQGLIERLAGSGVRTLAELSAQRYARAEIVTEGGGRWLPRSSWCRPRFSAFPRSPRSSRRYRRSAKCIR
jgi:DNA polymerase-3 subunit epsilon